MNSCATKSSVETALRGLAQLRRLFFSMLEHLRETAQRQVELGDDSEEVVALAEVEPEETAKRIGPLVPQQRCQVDVAFDDEPEQDVDFYRLRAAQANGQWVWLSPIWVER